jgi:hypothetical protein
MRAHAVSNMKDFLGADIVSPHCRVDWWLERASFGGWMAKYG